jgi:membrane protease YdiL (CAAX protease family)
MNITESAPKSKSLAVSLFTWVVVLLVSDLPNAIWQAASGEPPTWLFWIKTGLLLVLILVSLAWKPIQTVRPYFLLLFVLLLTLWGMNRLRGTEFYIQWEGRVHWVIAMAGFQLLKLAVAFIMIMVLLLMGRQKKDFFLTRGQLEVPIKAAKPEQNPGKRSISWGTLGLILGLCILPLTVLFFGVGNLPSTELLTKAAPLLLAALLFAATNAFSEEMQFRASLLGDLQKAIGPEQSIWLTATFFGFAHYFGGAPSGIPGFLIAGMLGALFAKCMLGSKGILVPWFIHFCQNAAIYAFWAFDTIG